MTETALQNKITDLTPNMGIRVDQRRAVAKSLGSALADAFRLSFNVQALHWNVEGPLFFSLHKLTDEQYETLSESVDEIAERIRTLGMPAPESLAELDERTEIMDLPTKADLQARVERLVTDYETASVRLQTLIRVAEENGDIRTADMLTEQLGRYEEFAWMLRATIA